VTERGTQARSVFIWVCEGTWRATVDAALDLAPAGARFTLLHVTPTEVADAVHGACPVLLVWPESPPEVATIPPPPPSTTS
jgi:hypothetical protein